jgi:hypothetical protein
MLYAIPRYWKHPWQYIVVYRGLVIADIIYNEEHLNTRLLFLNLGVREIVIVPLDI